MEESKKTYTIPIAIVIAGVLIAGALLFNNQGKNIVTSPKNAEKTTQDSQTSSSSLFIPEVTGNDHIRGNPTADIIVVEYSDTECPFCKNFQKTMNRVIDEYGKEGEVAWVYRHFPIEQLHKKAAREAEALECAAELGGNTGFWNYTDRLFSVTPSNNNLNNAELPNIAEAIGLNRIVFEQCLNSGKYTDKVQKELGDAQKAGGRGTPFSIIVLKKALSIEIQNFIASAAAQLPPRTIVISDDEKRVALNGALPFNFMKLILDVMLEKEITPPASGNK